MTNACSPPVRSGSLLPAGRSAASVTRSRVRPLEQPRAVDSDYQERKNMNTATLDFPSLPATTRRALACRNIKLAVSDRAITFHGPSQAAGLAILIWQIALTSLRAAPNVVAWGSNQFGQTNVPPELTNAVAIAAGPANSLALRRDGTVLAWGAGTTNTGSWPDLGQSMVPP